MMSEQNRKQLEAMTPEKRAIVEKMLAESHTPGRFAEEVKAREIIAEEVRQTGGITTEDGTFHKVKPPRPRTAATVFGAKLKAVREAQGLSVDQIAATSGIERAILFKLEAGATPNPTIKTLERYAEALGGRVILDFKPKEKAKPKQA